MSDAKAELLNAKESLEIAEKVKVFVRYKFIQGFSQS